MGVIAKQGSQSAAVLLVGVFLGYLTNIIVFPLCLKPDEIGLFRVLLSASALLATFVPLGTHGGIMKFFPSYKNATNGHNGIIGFVIKTAAFGLLMVVVFLFFFKSVLYQLYGDQIDSFHHFTFHLTILLTCVSLMSILTEYAKSLMKITFPFVFKQIIQRLMIILIVWLYFLNFYEINGLVFALDITFITILLFHIGYLVYLNAHKISFKNPFKSIQEKKAYTSYSFYVVLSGASFVFLDNIDTLMLGAIAGLEKTGIYSISFFIASVIDMPRRAIAQISSPIFSEAFKVNDMKKIDSIYKKTSLNNFLAGGFLFMLIWFNADNFFDIMPNGDVYKEAKNIILIIGLGRLVDIAFGQNGTILGLSNHYRMNALFIITFLTFAVLTNLILIPKFGIAGAAYATSISYILFNLLKHFFLVKKLNLSPLTNHFYKLVIIFSVLFGLNYISPNLSNPYLDFFVRSTILSLLTFAGYKIFKIESDLFDAVENQLIKIFRK